ncbi:MAG: protein translocase subunit SecF [Proteobacteria bacterium]|nr:protein translocase subunit SecF [Pseudomonadota bacterium]
MSFLQRAYRGDIHIDFVGRRRMWFTFSAVIVTVSVLSLILRGGFNLGIEFQGGVSLEVPNVNAVSVTDMRQAIADLGLGAAKVQTVQDLRGNEHLRIETAELDTPQREALKQLVAEVTGGEVGEFDAVSATFGSRVISIAVRALIIFLIAVTLYISVRLEWKMAIAALAALFHDVIFTAGIYALVGFEVTPETIIAILTILGYSLYDTVVVFDKVLENVSERGERHTYSALVNMSMNQVLMRSINTSLTSLLPVGSLLFVGSLLLGATTLREFALALFIGIAVGTYSSIFLAAPLLALWKEHEERWQRIRRRVERKGGAGEYAAKGIVSPEEDPVKVAAAMSGVVARAPRKRRRTR